MCKNQKAAQTIKKFLIIYKQSSIMDKKILVNYEIMGIEIMGIKKRVPLTIICC